MQHAKSLAEVSGQLFDCVYLAGGHGAMYDFPDDTVLQAIIEKHYESDSSSGHLSWCKRAFEC